MARHFLSVFFLCTAGSFFSSFFLILLVRALRVPGYLSYSSESISLLAITKSKIYNVICLFVAVLALQLLGQVRHSASNFKIVFLSKIV